MSNFVFSPANIKHFSHIRKSCRMVSTIMGNDTVIMLSPNMKSSAQMMVSPYGITWWTRPLEMLNCTMTEKFLHKGWMFPIKLLSLPWLPLTWWMIIHSETKVWENQGVKRNHPWNNEEVIRMQEISPCSLSDHHVDLPDDHWLLLQQVVPI